MCERTWNFDEPPQENWFGAEMEEGKLYTIVMDCCFPSHGSQQGTTVLVIVDGPEQRCPGYLAKAVPDFMSGCGCGRATLKSDSEPAIFFLQEAVKNSSQSELSEDHLRRTTLAFKAVRILAADQRRHRSELSSSVAY